MVQFDFLEGDLFVGKLPDDHHAAESDNADSLYRYVVFKSDAVDLRFYSAIGGAFPVKETSFHETEDGREVYYPYCNESEAELHTKYHNGELVSFKEDVRLEYAIVDGDVYVRSQNDITAYGGIPLLADGTLYQVQDSLLFEPGESSPRDEFLGMNPTEDPVRVKNLETGYSNPVSYNTVADLVENDDPNGALKVIEPADMMRSLPQLL